VVLVASAWLAIQTTDSKAKQYTTLMLIEFVSCGGDLALRVLLLGSNSAVEIGRQWLQVDSRKSCLPNKFQTSKDWGYTAV
jgi:hypothetical protein